MFFEITVYIPEYIHLQRWLPGSGVWETFRIDDVKHKKKFSEIQRNQQF